jgi:hypothetical protein
LQFAAIQPYCAGLLVDIEQTRVKSALNANETREAAMTLLTLCRSQHRVFLFAGVLGLSLLAAPLAQAFTIDDQSNAPVGGSARYTDPDSRLTGDGNNNGTTIYKQGNTSLQFGTQRQFDDRKYNTDRIFNPNGRPGDDR